MTELYRFSISVEPPLNVANHVLEIARNLAARVCDMGVNVQWLPPEGYMAPLVIVSTASMDAFELLLDRTRSTLKLLDECHVELGPLQLIGGSEKKFAMQVSGERLMEIAGAAKKALAVVGFEAEVEPNPLLVIGVVSDGADIAMTQIQEILNIPPLKWLMGGLAVYACSPGPGGTFLGRRLHFLPLRRLGERPDS